MKFDYFASKKAFPKNMKEQSFRERFINKLPNLIKDTTTVFTKVVAKEKWFESMAESILPYESLLSTNALGKMAGWLAKYVIEKESREVAFQHAISTTFIITFQEAIAKHEIALTLKKKENIEEQVYNEQSYTQQQNFSDFDIYRFLGNEIIKDYISLFGELLAECDCTAKQKRIVQRHFNAYLKLNFFTLIKQQNVAYRLLLNDIDNTRAMQAQSEIIQRKLYDMQLSAMFDEIVLNDEKDMRLSDVYIKPYVAIHQSCFAEKTKNKYEFQSFFTDLKNGFLNLDDKKTDLHNFIISILNNRIHKDLTNQKINIIFLFGNPGQGKTSFCKKLLYDVIVNDEITENNIYFLRLKNVQDIEALFNNPLRAIVNCLTDMPNVPDNVNIKQIKRNSLLVLDGLDELKMNAQIGTDRIEILCEKLIKEAENNLNLKIIVTSRYYVDLKKISYQNALILQIANLMEIQQRKWLEKYRYFHSESSLTLQKLEKYNKIDHLKELLNQPILLHLIARLSNEIDVKQNRVGIYKQLFTDLIERKWDQNGQIAALRGIKTYELRFLIQEMALSIFQSDYDYLHKTEIDKLKTVKKFAKKLAKNKINDVLKGVMIAFYLQEVRKQKNDSSEHKKERYEDYAIEFMHKSLQEYMAAERIWQILQDYFLEKDKYGDYKNDEFKAAYRVLAELFGPRMLSKEIIKYFKEIISLKSSSVRNELAECMAIFLDELIIHQFYCADAHQGILRLEHRVNHIDISMNIFYAYWNILLELKEEQNYINARNKNGFIDLIYSFNRRNIILNLSYQSLENVKFDIMNLNSANFIASDLKYGNFLSASLIWTNFENAKLYKAVFDAAILYETNFANADLFETHFSRTNLIKVDFSNADLEGANFEFAKFREAKSLTFKQLSKVRSLYKCTGLEEKLEKRLKKECPHLFEKKEAYF
ncbi:MAG: pentapeptide repeat-containing protein [Chitinophagales bacterium]